ncbi:DDB1- and CUL4-associated factor 8-like [Drosophila biarmipes]|uniref:DDB1- and CUL4-associated factor 8-like n=1 Tax=Drosophila biarmipes TaxID=125945 RepID=UPI0007E5EA95|nr:DDB1- and CUL4-associated factor 8-like [Drosophila biarmipes]
MEQTMGEIREDGEPEAMSGNTTPSAQTKKTTYSWNISRELYHRELNLTNRIGWRGAHTSAEGFNQAFYGSRQAVEQLTELFRRGKRGRCLSFNRAGDLLCSGYQLGNLVVWDWVNQKALCRFSPSRYGGVKRVRFLDSTGGLDIVSANDGGQVHRSLIPPSGGTVLHELLYSHEHVNQLIVVPQSRCEVMSCGSQLKHFDFRTHVGNTLLSCPQRIFSVAHHPYAPEICLGGSDEVLRVYDKRNPSTPLAQKSPFTAEHVSLECSWMKSVAYNHSGSEILVSYTHDDIYLFSTRDWSAGYLHKYRGRYNNPAGAAMFFGPKSEFILSTNYGAHILFWDRNTEALIKNTNARPFSWIHELEAHPWLPVLASAEAEHAIKLWAPRGGTENGLALMRDPLYI